MVVLCDVERVRSERITSLEEAGRLSQGKKRNAIPNPNKFMALAEVLVSYDAISNPIQSTEEAEAVEDVIGGGGGVEEDEGLNLEAEELPTCRTHPRRPRS
ncbi:hypothetical protein CEP51_016558 [Fusarium floridanum]|uniref:Uncharacterized protein n=1 Tax=Fusarium floridanum TaxID=1325733 RepID=A0A428NLN0_9HYPO|nr:hypothetical protein CEP51_016558 [Fusarium floridanum]